MKVVVSGAGIAGLALAHGSGRRATSSSYSSAHRVPRPLRMRCAVLRCAGVPGFDRYVARVLSGKPASVVSTAEVS